MLKKILRGVGTLALAGGLVVSGAALAAPAQASDSPAAATPVYVAKPIVIKSVSTDGDRYAGRTIAVASKGCKSNRLAVGGEIDSRAYVSTYTIAGDLYRNGKKFKTVTFRANSSAYYYDFCPKRASERYGTFQLKNIRVSGSYWVLDTEGNAVQVKDAKGNWVNLTKTFSYSTGKSSKTFFYKGDVDGKLRGYRAAGSTKRTFTATLTFFSDKLQKRVAYSPVGAHLQIKVAGKWVNLKNGALKFKNGQATFVVRTSKKYSYRMSVPPKAYAMGGATGGFTL